MPQHRDAHGRFAVKPDLRRAAGEAWDSQVRAAAKAAGRAEPHPWAKRRTGGPFARALSAEMRRARQDIRNAQAGQLRGLDPLLRGVLPIQGQWVRFEMHDDAPKAQVKVEDAPLVKVEPREARPEDKPYDWWKRLPVCDDDALNAALDRACRRAHPHWRHEYRSSEFRLALLGGGSFRDCFHALTLDGYDTRLIVKRPTRARRDSVRHGSARLQDDQGNGQEATVYLHLSEVAPEALSCFPVLYETEPVYGDWAVHEKVRPECYGKEDLRELEGRWRSAGVDGGDLHPGNVGRRDSDRCTLVIDWGHFTIRDFHSVEHRARR